MPRQARGPLSRFILALGLGILVGLACATAAWLFMPNVYEASALLEVAERQPSILGEDARGSFSTYKRAQAVLIKDPFILRAALLDPEIAKLSLIQDHKSDPERWLAEHLIVEYPGDATFLRISLRGNKPDELAKIVNAVTNKYLNEGLNRERTVKAREHDVLEQSLQDNQNRVREIRRSIHETSKKLGVTGSEATDLKKKVKLHELETLLTQRAEVQNEIRRLKLEISLLEAGAAPNADAGRLGRARLRLSKLEGTLAEDNSALQEMLNNVDKVDRYSSDLASLQNELDALNRVANQMDQKHRMWEFNKLASPRVSLVREASVPAASAPTPEKVFITAAAGIVGCCLTMICVVLSSTRQSQGT